MKKLTLLQSGFIWHMIIEQPGSRWERIELPCPTAVMSAEDVWDSLRPKWPGFRCWADGRELY